MPINIEIDSVGLLMKPRSSITMHATQKEVHAKIGDEDGEESQRHIHMTVHADAAMGRNGIDHQGDESPRLFWVPRPVGAPRHIGPDGTNEDSITQEGDGRKQQELRQVERCLTEFRLDDAHQTAQEDKEQQGVGHHDGSNVDGQQTRVEHRQGVVLGRVFTQKVVHHEDEAHKDSHGEDR